MLNASDDILNQINCTDSSGEDGGKSLKQPKIRSCPTWNPPPPPPLPQYTLTPPKVNSPIPRYSSLPQMYSESFWEHHYQQAWVILETEDSNQKIQMSDSVLASNKKANAAL